MKIAIYQDLPHGGARRSIEAIIALLHENHDIRLFGSPHVETKNRFVSDWRALVGQRIIQRRLAHEIDAEKFDVVLVTHDRYLQCPWLLRYLKTPAVFLCQEPTRAYYEYFLRIPDRWPFLNRVYEIINRLLRKKIEEENARFADVVVANSFYSAEVLFRVYGVTAMQVYLGINTSEYYPNKVKKENQVVVVGNDEHQKDLGLAIRTVGEIKENRPKLIIASPRVYKSARLERIAKREKVKLEIVFGRTIDQLREIYTTSRLTLATAHLEPFGLSVIESLACGTPVVAVKEGGFRETVSENQTGLLVERSAAALAEACHDLLTHPDKAAAFGEAGINHVTANFTWEKTVAKLVKILENAQKRKRPARR